MSVTTVEWRVRFEYRIVNMQGSTEWSLGENVVMNAERALHFVRDLNFYPENFRNAVIEQRTVTHEYDEWVVVLSPGLNP